MAALTAKTSLGGSSARKEGALSPHDWGRVAELNLLASKLEVPTLASTDRARIRRELTALVEELGLRNDTPAATARRLALVREHALSPEANRALFDAQTGLTKPVSSLPTEDRALVQDVKDTAARRDQQHLEADERRRSSQLDPLTPTKDQLNVEGRVPLAEQRRIAHEAEQRREKKSGEVVSWLHQLHTSRPPGADYATIEMPVWIGGGASTVGLTPDTLFIDARGRWQQDASANIAQTAQQLSELYGAGMGDPGHFAKPNERVPLDAIRAFEDNLAAQARVVNGYANMTVDQNGRTLLTITPYHGQPVTVVVGGNRAPVFATGFPRESVPGQRTTLHDAVRVLKQELTSLGFDPGHTLGRHTGVTDKDAAEIGETLRGSREAAEILSRGSPEAKRALESLLAAENWESARAHDPKRRRILRGDEANLVRDFRKTGVHDWVIAGQGGTAISAAEVILNQTRGMKPPVTVRMLGQSNPEGLSNNTQWKEVFKKFGPSGENRLFAERVEDIGELALNRNGEAAGLSVRDQPNGPSRTVAGEGIIVSMGRAGLLPPPIADHVVEVYNEQHGTPRVPGSSVAGQLLWGANGQYLGYRVVATRHGKTVTFDVTGAQSRYLPPELFPNKAVRELVAPEWRSSTPASSTAQGRDASATSGNFAGGFGPSATQARDYQALASEGTIRVMDAEGNFQ